MKKLIAVLLISGLVLSGCSSSSGGSGIPYYYVPEESDNIII